MILSIHKKLSMLKKIEYAQTKFWESRWTRHKWTSLTCTLRQKNFTYFATIVFNEPVITIDTARVKRYAVHLIFVGKFWPPHYDLTGFPMILISEINSSPNWLYCKFSFSALADRAPVVFKQQSYLLLNFEKLLLFWSKTPKW